MNTLIRKIPEGLILTILVFFNASTPGTASGQKLFSEGVLLYDVRLKDTEASGGLAASKTKKGIYRLTIKKAQVKKELILENGKVTRTSIADYKTGLRQVLREREGVLYVVETELETKKRNHAENSFRPSGQRKILNGYEVVAGTLRLGNGQRVEGYVYPEYYLPYPAMLRRFQAIQGIPAAFTLSLSDGSQLQFELKSIREEPVLNATFSIPENYRRISKEAYKKFRQ